MPARRVFLARSRGGSGEILLLMWRQLFFGWRGGALGAAFVFYVLCAIGDFIVDLFDFQSEMKFSRMLCIFLEKRISFRFQVVAFFLPDPCNCEHVIVSATSVHVFLVYRYRGMRVCADKYGGNFLQPVEPNTG